MSKFPFELEQGVISRHGTNIGACMYAVRMQVSPFTLALLTCQARRTQPCLSCGCTVDFNMPTIPASVGCVVCCRASKECTASVKCPALDIMMIREPEFAAMSHHRASSRTSQAADVVKPCKRSWHVGGLPLQWLHAGNPGKLTFSQKGDV